MRSVRAPAHLFTLLAISRSLKLCVCLSWWPNQGLPKIIILVETALVPKKRKLEKLLP